MATPETLEDIAKEGLSLCATPEAPSETKGSEHSLAHSGELPDESADRPLQRNPRRTERPS